MRLVSTVLISKISILQASLADEKSGRVLPFQDVAITDESTVCPTSASPQKPQDSDRPMFLCIQPTFNTPGKFTGTIALSSREKPELGSFPITIYSTSRIYQLVGLACVAFGLFTYMTIAIWARYRSRLLSMLLPAARLRDEAIGLLKRTQEVKSRTGFGFPNLLAPAGNPSSLFDIVDRLSVAKIKEKNFLPSGIVSPFASPDVPMAYQTFLQTNETQISNLDMVVRWGLASVLAMWSSVKSLGLVIQGNTALATLDGLATFVGPSDQLRSQIQSALSTLQSAISSAASLKGGAAATAAVYDVSTSQQMMMQIDTLNATVWAIWAVLTIAVGSCALVWFNDGFGTPQDMIQCFLWGVGMPAIAQGFGGLSSGSLTSAFSFQIPR
jgi:hypothetical protein